MHIELSRLTIANKVYRGITGMALPEKMLTLTLTQPLTLTLTP